MKKQDNNKIFKLFVSSILVFSIFLTNISNIVVYGADAYSTEQNENTQNRKSDSSNLGRNVDTIQSNFNDIIDGLHSLLNDEQIEVFNTITANDDEVTELLKKAMILHENAEFEQAVELYDQVSAYLSEEMDDTSEATVQLVEAFSQLAETKVLLLEHEYIESTPTETEEPSEGKEINEIAESAEDNKHSESELDELTKEENTNGNNSNNKTAEEYIIPEAEEDESTKETATDQSEIQATSTMRASVAEPITSEKEVMYDAVLTRSIDGINTKPYGTEGYELIRLVDDLVGHQVRVTREAETPRSTWAYIEVDETDISGWIDKAGIDPVETVLSEKAINYEGKLARPTDGINTRPFGVAGSQLIRLVDDWEGRRVRATREAVTRRSTWAYVNVVGTDVSGWIDKAGLDIDSTTAEREVLYDAVLTRSTDGINTKPYGTEGYELVRLVDDLVGHQVRVTREAETPRSTWAYIEVTGTNISGWIDKAGIDPVETVLSEKAINYEGKLARPTDGINTRPFGVAGSQLIRLVDDWEGRRVRATREAVTRRSTWAYVNVVGTDVSGWIDKAGLDIDSTTAEREVLYDAVLTRSTDGINTKPYGTEGYELIRLVDDLVGHQVRVTREAETPRSTWAYIEVDETDISGWIDKAGIDPVETVLSEKAINYEGKLARPTDGINTKPFGVAGSELIRLVDDWEGRRVRVTREAVTRRSTWAYVNVIGTDVSGWIDKAGLEVETVLASKEVTYNANLKRSTDGINTKPYGTEGYELIRTVGDWEGKEVRVIREAVTQRSTWAYVEVIGAGIAGWVDKTGLDIENYVVYLDPGHGGSDSGASYNGVHEKNLNLSVSMKTKDLLENKGYTVVMSRTNDSTVGLYDRPAEANSIGADILVSVHHNAMPGNTNVTGIETYYYKSSSNYPPLNENLPYHDDTERLNDSLNLAQLIQDELINHTNTNDRGVKSAAFVVVRETHMPAVLLELGYMSSPSELNKLQQTGYQYAMANAVADAIDNYFRK